MPESMPGLAARMERMEADAREQRERRDALLRENAAERNRIWTRLDEHANRMTALEVEAREWRREVREDLHEIRDAIKEVKGEVAKQREGTFAQRIAYISAAGAVLAALLIAVATIVSALQ